MTNDFENRARRRAKKSQGPGVAIAGSNSAGALAPKGTADQGAVDEVVSKGPSGAFALAGTAIIIIVALWIAFYFLIFLPRG